MNDAEWRDTAQICSQWREAARIAPAFLECKVSRGWWSMFLELGITLLITREYEHLVMALGSLNGRPHITYLPLPHPSGLTVDRASGRVQIASTRNPNQVYTYEPTVSEGGLLAPVSSVFYPGNLYLHDLARIGSSLFANAVGHNAVARLGDDGSFERVWWPDCVERAGEPDFSRNYIQLNSIAAGRTLRSSFFTASSTSMGRLRPGHLKYPVDRRGVIFSGATREPFCTGLTRPHSARLKDGRVWVANSGYGELGFAEDCRLHVVARLPGWTRGLCIVNDIAFVATSRVIPRYAAYAPGLDVSKTRCAVHAVCCKSGKVLGSLEWPEGNQIFAIDWIAAAASAGFPFEALKRRHARERAFFYSYATR
ncbi:MAG TPA: DUF4915 domain-containing protein [Bryobacteraceae bacterium]|nr:DUF4915 domain-containing protein [Bryobacteraceae bacterium]